MNKPRDIVLKTLEGRKAERTPVALVGGGMWSAYNYGATLGELSTDPLRMSDMLVDMAKRIQSDIVYAGSGYPSYPVAALGGKIKFRDIGAPDIEEPVVYNEDDLMSLDISRITSDKVINTLYEAFMTASSKIGDEYIVTMTAWAPFTLGARFTGEEAMLKALLKRPEFARRVLGFAVDLLIRFYEPLINRGLLEVILLGDPTASGDLISKKQYEEFALPYLREFTEWARRKGVHTILHICGNTTDRLELFPLADISCVSLDHKTDMRRAREVLAGRLCFAGNVDPVRILLLGSPGQVGKECLRVMEAAGTDSGFLLMPGCDIPPTVTFENIRAFMQAVKNQA